MDKRKASTRGTTDEATSPRHGDPLATDSMTGRLGGTASAGSADTAATRTSSGGSRTSGNGQQHGVMHAVKEKAAAQLESQKGRATDEIDAIAQAVRGATERLRTEQHETVAHYVDRAADGLERLSRTLREKQLNDLLHDAQRLARRQPAVFIGGSFALGLLAARFLKSAPETGSSEGSRGAADWSARDTRDWAPGRPVEPGYDRGAY